MVNADKPVFQQIIDMIEDDILTGVYAPDDMIISTTQISKLLGVNPTTSVKAVSILTERDILYKKRGLGMAVTAEARALILDKRKRQFFKKTLPEFVDYAAKIGISSAELAALVEESTND